MPRHGWPSPFQNRRSKPCDLVAETQEKPGVMQGEANGLHHLHQPGGAHQTGPDSTKGGYFPAVNRALIARCASTRASFAAHRRRSPVGPVAAFELPVQPDLMRTRVLSSNARCCWTFDATVPSRPIEGVPENELPKIRAALLFVYPCHLCAAAYLSRCGSASRFPCPSLGVSSLDLGRLLTQAAPFCCGVGSNPLGTTRLPDA